LAASARPQLAGSQQPRRFASALFHLISGQASRVSCHGSPAAQSLLERLQSLPTTVRAAGRHRPQQGRRPTRV